MICLVLGALGGVATALVTQPAPARPPRSRPPRTAPPTYRLRDENGVVRTPTSARGKVLMLTFIFTRCRSACPRIAVEMRDAMRAAGSGVETHAITVDPKHDTPEQRAGLAQAHRASRRGRATCSWAAGASSRPVWERFGIVPVAREGAPRERRRASYGRATQPSPADDANPAEAALDHYPATDDGFYRGRLRHGGYLDYEHSAYVLLIDEQGRQRVGFPFEQATSERLLHDIRLLQREPGPRARGSGRAGRPPGEAPRRRGHATRMRAARLAGRRRRGAGPWVAAPSTTRRVMSWAMRKAMGSMDSMLGQVRAISSNYLFHDAISCAYVRAAARSTRAACSPSARSRTAARSRARPRRSR